MFFENLEFVEEHNAKNTTFKVAINVNSDTSFNQIFKINNQVLADSSKRINNSTLKFVPMELFELKPNAQIPDSFDWRDRSGILTEEVREQGSCLSCYAHVGMQVIEAQLALRYNKSVKLSAQEIIDCASSDKHALFHCEGGSVMGDFIYINEMGGVSLDEDYPQTKVAKSCNKNPKRLNITIEKMWVYYNKSEEDVKAALYSYGPLFVKLDGLHNTFIQYSSGIYYEPDCYKSVKNNHYAMIVGYGSENGVDFWTIKNSYNDNWGEKGYIRMARNKNHNCQVGFYVGIPDVKM